MTQFAIVTDLNRCVGCLTCSVACKFANDLPPGDFWLKVFRIGPNPINEGDTYPEVEMYYKPVGCQHCRKPECVAVCPTGASHKREDGTVQIDKQRCIGCQFCTMACPYNVRYLNEVERVVEKCTLCEQRVSQGDLPECVRQCNGRARFFGDLDKGLESFMGPGTGPKPDTTSAADPRELEPLPITTYSAPWSEADIHHMTDAGNDPASCFILRNRKWRG
ncbi:MAG: 4Fe-4S dicluster domain-containing protein [Eggerthellaceae bacterium]|nr:4Fe-4S dicluster domain-containing protein [Eggerthellaceae bacterium]